MRDVFYNMVMDPWGIVNNGKIIGLFHDIRSTSNVCVPLVAAIRKVCVSMLAAARRISSCHHWPITTILPRPEYGEWRKKRAEYEPIGRVCSLQLIDELISVVGCLTSCMKQTQTVPSFSTSIAIPIPNNSLEQYQYQYCNFNACYHGWYYICTCSPVGALILFSYFLDETSITGTIYQLLVNC